MISLFFIHMWMWVWVWCVWCAFLQLCVIFAVGDWCFGDDGAHDARRCLRLGLWSQHWRWNRDHGGSISPVLRGGSILFYFFKISTKNFWFSFPFFYKYLTVESPSGRQIWRMSIQDGLQALTTPWYQFRRDNNLMARDEVVFYYGPNQGVWEIILRKDIGWDED